MSASNRLTLARDVATAGGVVAALGSALAFFFPELLPLVPHLLP